MARNDASPVTGRTVREAPKPPDVSAPGNLDRHVWDLPVDAKRIKGSTTVTGQVAGDGTITAGEGFSVSHVAASAVYNITFDVSYAAAPTVIVCGGNMGTPSRVHRISDVTTTTVQITSTGGDEPFNFVAFTTI